MVLPYRPPPQTDVLMVESRSGAKQRGMSNRSQPLGRSHANRQDSRGFLSVAGVPLAACTPANVPFNGEGLNTYATCSARPFFAAPARRSRRFSPCDCPAGTDWSLTKSAKRARISTRSTVARPAVKGLSVIWPPHVCRAVRQPSRLRRVCSGHKDGSPFQLGAQ